MANLESRPEKFEFHRKEIWNGQGCWTGKPPSELLRVYEEVVGLVGTHQLSISHATIDRQLLHDKYNGAWDASAYLLALQFLLEKINSLPGLKVIVADESKEQEFEAKPMVARLQDWGGGEVPGRQLHSVIDSLHCVQSHETPGVQIADMVAYLLHRARLRARESHPEAESSRQRMLDLVAQNTPTYRMTWPSAI
jgi:hypothetical protein